VDSVLANRSQAFATTEANNPWQIVKGSLAFANNQATWHATHWVAPVAPTGCFVAEDQCNGSIDAFCDASGDTLQLERLVTFSLPRPGHVTGIPISMWQDESGIDVTWNASPTMVDQSPPVNENVTYRVCARNILGEACGPEMTIYARRQPCVPVPPGGLHHLP
jgi:hypothetical protein